MAYCALADIQKRIREQTLIELTDDDGTDAVDAEVVAAAIADADEEIDAYLALRYSLPFSTAPAIVLRMSAELAVCNLFGRRDHLELPGQWAERCAAVRKMLEKFADGRLRLDVPEPDVASDDGVGVTSAKDDRTFTIGRASTGATGSLDNY